MSEVLISVGALTLMEIVLGIDNVVFIAILADKLPANQQFKARAIGLGIALGARVALIFTISWILGLTKPLFSLLGHVFSGRDLVLLAGGAFLIGKATIEIYDKMEGDSNREASGAKVASFRSIIAQIVVLDVVFSLDSVITAVGMVKEIWMMVVAIVIAMILMLWFSEMVASFISKHPSVKILALSFLILIGVFLVAEGLGQHINRGYIYSAMAFSLLVEVINMRVRNKKRYKEAT